MICHFQLLFSHPSSNPLSRSYLCWFPFFFRSHRGGCVNPACVSWIKQSKHLGAGCLVYLGRERERESRVRGSRQTNLTVELRCVSLSQRWLFGKMAAHHVVTVPFSSLFLLLCLPASCLASGPWTEQWMNLGSSSWVRHLFPFFSSSTVLNHSCAKQPHTQEHTIQHNKAAHLGKLMWASLHGNTAVVN